MRVTIDATAVLLRSAGVKGYVWNWVQALRRSESPHQFAAFPFLGDLSALHHDRSILSAIETYPRLAALYAAARSSRALKLLIPRSDIFHASNQVRQNPGNCKLTATVHDVTASAMAKLHTAANQRADREFTERILKHADGLIAISENSKRDAIELLGVKPEKIVRIYPGIPPEYFTVTEYQAKDARDRLNLTHPFVLCVGTIEPRKNVDRLLNAWERLPPDVRADFELVIAGPEGWGTESTLCRLRNAPPGVRYLGYVPETLMAALTRAATVLAYPSLYEGFGLPLAQAMAAGVPVLTSQNSCLPEVGGEGAIYVDPLSITEIRNGLLTLLTAPSERDRLSAAGRLRARTYTWKNCACESIHFFETVAGGAAPGA